VNAVPAERIEEGKKYYVRALVLNSNKNNGKIRCDECGELIKHPTGSNVCHIVGKGANLTCYFDVRNHFILGKGEMFGECECKQKFDDRGEKKNMKIYEQYLKIRDDLNSGYYNKKAD